MRLKKILCLLMFVALIFLSACSNPEGKSQAVYETAQFEELQNNLKHAKQLYEEIVSDYPGSSFADKAKERLNVLNSEEEAE